MAEAPTTMLTHLVPQKYLQGFGVLPDRNVIWQYDCAKRAWSEQPLPISKVCARKGFYSDEDEADLNRLIEAELTAVDDTAPAVTITGPATEPVIGPFPITVVFSEPVTSFELKDLVVGNGVASELERDGARYAATVTPTAPGPVTVDIAAGAAEDSAGNPSTAAEQFSITVELTPVPALPVAGVIALAALLLIGVIRRRNQNQYLATTGGRGSPYFGG